MQTGSRPSDTEPCGISISVCRRLRGNHSPMLSIAARGSSHPRATTALSLSSFAGCSRMRTDIALGRPGASPGVPAASRRSHSVAEGRGSLTNGYGILRNLAIQLAGDTFTSANSALIKVGFLDRPRSRRPRQVRVAFRQPRRHRHLDLGRCSRQAASGSAAGRAPDSHQRHGMKPVRHGIRLAPYQLILPYNESRGGSHAGVPP